jgi:hypothetical protein
VPPCSTFAVVSRVASKRYWERVSVLARTPAVQRTSGNSGSVNCGLSTVLLAASG